MFNIWCNICFQITCTGDVMRHYIVYLKILIQRTCWLILQKFSFKKKFNYLKCFIRIWLISLEKHVFVDNYNKRPTPILLINVLFNVKICKNNTSLHFFLKIKPHYILFSICVFSTVIVFILYIFKYIIICVNTSLFNNNYIQVQNIVLIKYLPCTMT